MIKKILAAILFSFLVVFSLSGCEQDTKAPAKNQDAEIIDYDKTAFEIRVKLETDENCVVTSENPVRIKPGEDAKFSVLFKDNYGFDQVNAKDAAYKDGIVTIKGCKINKTYGLTSKSIAKLFKFDIVIPEEEFGTVEYSAKIGTLLENTLVSVSANPAENQTFIGWSNGATALEGGSIVSYSGNYSFPIKSDMKLYANFLTAGYSIVKYNLNGGTTADGSSDVIISQFSGVNHMVPNLIPDNGTIVRDGYTLIEFTENQDGTGEATSPGGMVRLPDKGGILELYAQWSEWSSASNFMYKVNEFTGEVTITAYTANEATVSIPAYIEGKPVTTIASGAFFGKSFETLVVPRTVVKMEAGAFKSCSKFDTLYITDSFTSIPDNAFDNCNKFKNLRLNASLDPCFVNFAESMGVRLEKVLARDGDKPIILFVGGSSCLYGIKAEQIEADLDYKFQVINAGTNAGGTGLLYMEGFAHFLREGDIIVNVPEYGANQMGKTDIVWRTFRATETCYNIYRYVDFSKYTHFFSAMSEFNTSAEARAASRPSNYDQKITGLTPRYCDLAGNKPANLTNTFNATNVRPSNLSDDAIANINNFYRSLQSAGIYYYFSCAPVLHEGGKGTLSTEENLKAFYTRASTSLACPVISTPIDYLYKNTEYNNSNYHLCTEASYKHSSKIVEDLKAQLKADGLI